MTSTIISILTFLPLMVAALAHLFWALGATWPIRDELLLAQTVVGSPGITRMPNKLLTLLVAILLFASGVVAMGLADHDDGGFVRTVLGVILAVVFLGRGVVGYTPGWRARHPVEPFATLDRKNYSPLCFWIGAGFLILVGMRLL
jgi:Protein of unknown function (DUF3995)